MVCVTSQRRYASDQMDFETLRGRRVWAAVRLGGLRKQSLSRRLRKRPGLSRSGELAGVVPGNVVPSAPRAQGVSRRCLQGVSRDASSRRRRCGRKRCSAGANAGDYQSQPQGDRYEVHRVHAQRLPACSKPKQVHLGMGKSSDRRFFRRVSSVREARTPQAMRKPALSMAVL